MSALHLFLIILEIARTEPKLLFSRSGGEVGVSSFSTVYRLPLQDCRTECMARSSCASVNYFRSSQKCELNKMATGVWNVAEKTGSVYSEKTDWTDNQFDQCSCKNGQKCVVTSEGHRCVVEECDRLPSQTPSDLTTVGAKADISVQCMEDIQGFVTFGAGARPNTTRATMTCSPDGTWKMKKPSGGACLVVVFVMVPGTGQDPYYEWISGTSSSSKVTWNQYYRNGVIDKWSMLTISHIRFSIFKNLQEVKHVVFNGAGSTNLDWFVQSRVIESSWNDLSSADYNYFDVFGGLDALVTRRFFMNRFYLGCPSDQGWFTATIRAVCGWETVPAYPVFVYSTLDTASVLQTDSDKADFVYVTLRLETY